MFPQDSISPVWVPDRLIRHVLSHEISGVLESGTEGRWGDQKLVESGPEGAKEKPKGE